VSRRGKSSERRPGNLSDRQSFKYPEPPEYQQKGPRKRPKIGEFLPIIHEILKSDQQVHRKQRHTAKRIFARLQAEHE